MLLIVICNISQLLDEDDIDKESISDKSEEEEAARVQQNAAKKKKRRKKKKNKSQNNIVHVNEVSTTRYIFAEFFKYSFIFKPKTQYIIPINIIS